ncbi:MAG: type I-E CRISPR-associated endoribonuclease Cas2e [Oscillospiraceae bacterium]|jgi:CRISPR-associated protein Cas2|nr:type I-E CRISPR-associated endoribonuclease Cas2e [Oscillospiraceae bacterium]
MMMVLSLTDCPNALRGDLTRWLFEIDTNVYVGSVSARVRDELWKRVTENAKSGRAVLVYPAKNEQGLEFRVHNNRWEIRDFDGLTLMFRPFDTHMSGEERLKPGFSNAAKNHRARRFSSHAVLRGSAEKGASLLRGEAEYIVLDIETTGLDHSKDEIVEIGALRVESGEVTAVFKQILAIEVALPPAISKLTGITDEEIRHSGRDPFDIMRELAEFTGDLPIVSHNVDFDIGFLRNACRKMGLPLPVNRCIDTLVLARRRVKDVVDHKLGTLAEHFGIERSGEHRGYDDCLTVKRLYEELMKLG